MFGIPVISTLCELLESKSRCVRGTAHKILMSMGQSAFVPLTQVFRTTHESGVYVILSVLRQINPIQTQEFVVAMLQDADSHIRLRGLESMRLLNLPIPADVVIAALKDPDVGIRQIGLINVSASHDEVAQIMLHDPDRNLRIIALYKLAQAGDKRATEPMMEKYSSKDLLRGDTIRWLRELQDVRSVSLLIDALADESEDGRVTATWRWVTEDRSPGTVADEAYDALRQLGEAARPGLTAAVHHTNPIVRQKVHKLLQLLP